MFSNNQIDSTKLPSLSDIEYKGLQKEYLNAEIITQIIIWVIVLLVSFGSRFFMDDEVPSWTSLVLLGITLLLAIMSFLITIYGFRRKQYALRERDIIYSSGLFWRSKTVIPFNRVQHAEVMQGPIDRLFNLSKLLVYTAGGSSSDLSIPGLSPEEAESIKHFILVKTISDEEE